MYLLASSSQQILDDEALLTLLTVAEGIINNRPITKLSDDPRDARLLTPNHILMPRSGPSLPPGQFVEQDWYRRCWKQVQYLADVFWRQWLREYLPNLLEGHKWMKPQKLRGWRSSTCQTRLLFAVSGPWGWWWVLIRAQMA